MAAVTCEGIDTGHWERRAALVAAYGCPVRVPGGHALRILDARSRVHPRDVVAFLYRDRAAAEAWAAANAEHYGHPSLGITPAEGGVLGVVDLRPDLARHGVPATDPAAPDDWRPGTVPPKPPRARPP